MKPVVFIQTNDRQMIGALVGAHALRRNAAQPDSFDVRILNQRDFPFFAAREGQLFLRDGRKQPWRNDDLQSFTPLRFLPPELMGYQGRAVVIDPDVFAVGDIGELLSRDMQGKALLCRYRAREADKPSYLASSVMLLDCAKLTHWKCEAQFNELFAFTRDYIKWVYLEYEPRETIGLFEEEWNDFDRLTDKTRLLHNTKRSTQPWKTGLPVDFMFRKDTKSSAERWRRYAKNLFRGAPVQGVYKRHPDPRQEQLFFGLLRECLDRGIVTEAMLREEMAKNHLRHDALRLLEQVPALAA